MMRSKRLSVQGASVTLEDRTFLEDDETFQNMIPFGFIGQDSADRRQEGGERANAG